MARVLIEQVVLSRVRVGIFLSAMTTACGRTGLLEDELAPLSTDAGAVTHAPVGSQGTQEGGAFPPSGSSDGGSLPTGDGGIDVNTACVGIAGNVFVVVRDDGSPPVILKGKPGWQEPAPERNGWQLAAYPTDDLPTDIYATTISKWHASFSTYSLRTPLEPGRTYTDTHSVDPNEYTKPNAGFEIVEEGNGCAKRGRFEVLDLAMADEGSGSALASFTIVFEYSCGDGERLNRGCIHMMR